MRQLVPLLSRRVPLYVSVPIIVACAAAGYIVSTLRPGDATKGAPPIHRAAEPRQAPDATTTVTESFRVGEPQLSAGLTSPRDAPSIALPPTGQLDLPTSFTPAPRVVERNEQVKSASSPVAVTQPQPPHVNGPVRSASKTRRPQRTARQPTKMPAASPTGLKSVPLIGPVFSLLQ